MSLEESEAAEAASVSGSHPAHEQQSELQAASAARPTEPWSRAFSDRQWSVSRAYDDPSLAPETIDYEIEGLLARTGTAVWFGNGSTGKTQMLLWMAAAIAAPRDRVPTWLGKQIHSRGHVLILSAEDTREHLHARLRTLIGDVLGLTGEDALETARRLHVLPFLSMNEAEFAHPNAGLFSDEGRVWAPNKKMLEIRALIEDWNKPAGADEPLRDEDKIIGVIMDSATSMAGFDAMEGGAVTNFFFYLNRLCEQLRLFWVVIGHTPKDQKINPRNPDLDAAARLRGPAIWTTAPRTTVEVRTALGPAKKGASYEAYPVIRSGLAERAEDVIIVKVAKSNFHDVDRTKRFLVRRSGGVFEDVTSSIASDDLPASTQPASGISNPAAGFWLTGPGPSDKASVSVARSNEDRELAEQAAQAAKDAKLRAKEAELVEGTDAIWKVIQDVTADRADGRIAASELSKLLVDWTERFPALRAVRKPGTNKEDGSPRRGAINWHLEQLTAAGLLVKREKRFAVASKAEQAADGQATLAAEAE